MNRLDQKGVTLMELMITLAIVAITAAISIPMYINDLPRQRVKGAAQGVLTDLRLSRARAVANNAPYLLCFSGSSYTLVSGGLVSSTNCTGGGMIEEKKVDFNTDFNGVEFGVQTGVANCPGSGSTSNAVGFVDSIARFNRLGASVDGSGTLFNGVVYLKNPKDAKKSAYCIQVDGMTGRGKLYRWIQGEWQ